jgi:predicted membrane metal-binding protein
LTANAHALPFVVRAWLRSIVVGDKSRLAARVGDVFRKTGLYHLLVVSGQHVSLVAFLMSFVLRLPLQAAYAARLIAPPAWQRLAAALTVASIPLAVVYAAATGMSAASQRALVLFVVWQVTKVFFGSLPVTRRLLLGAALQAAFFPIGFLSEASLMSWAAYLLVIAEPKPLRAPLRKQVAHALWLQLQLLVVSGACFGQLPLLGLVANGLFVSLFTLMLGLGLALLVWPGIPGGALLVEMQTSFVAMLTQFSRLCDLWPWLALPAAAMPAAVRTGLAAASAVILLNTFRRLTISPYETN